MAQTKFQGLDCRQMVYFKVKGHCKDTVCLQMTWDRWGRGKSRQWHERTYNPACVYVFCFYITGVPCWQWFSSLCGSCVTLARWFFFAIWVGLRHALCFNWLLSFQLNFTLYLFESPFLLFQCKNCTPPFPSHNCIYYSIFTAGKNTWYFFSKKCYSQLKEKSCRIIHFPLTN